MDLTRDKVCSLIHKRQSIIEASVDCKTVDGYILRMFCIAFTKPQKNQVKVTCYANSAQIRAIRAKMVQYMNELGSKGDLKSLVKELITANIGEDIEGISRCIFPIKDCYIRKVKVLKKPKFDVTALMEWHTDEATDTGVPVNPSENVEHGAVGAGGRY